MLVIKLKDREKVFSQRSRRSMLFNVELKPALSSRQSYLMLNSIALWTENEKGKMSEIRFNLS